MTNPLRVFLLSALLVAAAAPAAYATHEHKGAHHLAIQVNSDDPQAMNLALNNAANASNHYTGKGESVEIEIVAYGPGLHMLRDDTSPVKERLKAFRQGMPNVSFVACGNTRAGMKKAEGKEIPLVAEATEVPAGVVRLMELQEKGWPYIRP